MEPLPLIVIGEDGNGAYRQSKKATFRMARDWFSVFITT